MNKFNDNFAKLFMLLRQTLRVIGRLESTSKVVVAAERGE